MARATIDVGIDLGTTNSAIAVIQHGTPFIVPDNDSSPITPSVVRINPSGAETIGRRAYDWIYADPENTASEFKRWMGTTQTKCFGDSGREMTAPQLSAVILKSLRNNVQQHLGESIDAAVITVPAAFDLNQTSATQEAAAIAGIAHAPLLQEPIAASLAFGFRVDMEGRNWLVYDLGGGTFDLALVGVRDGRVQVIDHEGDNYLGGKDFDWILVERIVIPRLAERFRVDSFQRDNQDRRSDMAKLKGIAEKAKIELSRTDSAIATIETLRKPIVDDAGVEIETDIHIDRDEYEAAIAPLVNRSVTLAATVLSRNASAPVDSVLLVGGPTLTPLIRQRLPEALNVSINAAANPMTVVAEGAALFAATQPLPRRMTSTTVVPGMVVLDLTFKSVTDDDTVLVGARVPEQVGSIEFAAGDRSWSSGQLAVTSGRLTFRLPLPRKGPHDFQVVARMTDGTILAVEPTSIVITRGLTAAAAPLSKSFGVIVDDGSGDHRVEHLIAKGTPLPARVAKEFRSTVTLEPGGVTEIIQVYIVEGESERADRSRRIGEITITDRNVSRRVPAGSPIEVMIEISESRLLKATAYVSLIDESFPAEIQLGAVDVLASDLARELTLERDRLARIAEHMPASRARDLHERLRDVASDIRASQSGDAEASQRALRNLQNVQLQIDEIEDAQRLPNAIAEARAASGAASWVVMEHGDEGHRARLRVLIEDLDEAIRSSSMTEIRRAGSRLDRLRFEILSNQPSFWIGFFKYLSEDIHSWTDEGEAAALISRGQKQLVNEDIPGLSQTCLNLRVLVPPEEQGQLARFRNVGIRL